MRFPTAPPKVTLPAVMVRACAPLSVEPNVTALPEKVIVLAAPRVTGPV